MLQHFGYKIFIAICDLLLYPFIHIDITGNIGIVLYWSSTLIAIVTHLYYIGNALIGIILVIPIGTMLPFIDNIGIILILYYIGYTHWYNVAHLLIILVLYW